MTLEIIRNDGRFGVGRMDWLLVCDGELVSHCGLRFPLEANIASVRSNLRDVIFPRENGGETK